MLQSLLLNLHRPRRFDKRPTTLSGRFRNYYISHHRMKQVVLPLPEADPRLFGRIFLKICPIVLQTTTNVTRQPTHLSPHTQNIHNTHTTGTFFFLSFDDTALNQVLGSHQVLSCIISVVKISQMGCLFSKLL